MGDPNDPAVLLIMGLGAQLLLWRKDFCEKLVNQGLRVIRYDNRDVGLSSKVTGQHTGRSAGAADGALVSRAAQPGGLHARGRGRRRRRAARPPRDRHGPHRRRIDGRHDRPGLRRAAQRAHQDAGRDLLQQQPAACCRRPDPNNCWPSCSGPRTPPARRSSRTPSGSAGSSAAPAIPRPRTGSAPRPSRATTAPTTRPASAATSPRSWAAAACCATTAQITAPTVVIHGKADKLMRPFGGRAIAARDQGRPPGALRRDGPRVAARAVGRHRRRAEDQLRRPLCRRCEPALSISG